MLVFFVLQTELGVEDEGSNKGEGGSRRRRAVATTRRCSVKQMAGLDPTEPAFQVSQPRL